MNIIFPRSVVKCIRVILMLAKDKIKQYRKDLGMTAVDLAEKIDVSQGNVSRYESGSVRKIPDDVLRKIAKVLKCSVNDLVKDDPAYAHLHKQGKRKELTDSSSSFDDQLILDWYHSKPPEIQDFIKSYVVYEMTNAFDQ